MAFSRFALLHWLHLQWIFSGLDFLAFPLTSEMKLCRKADRNSITAAN